jgi:pyridoxamine 5'-phosphate oxidase
MFDSLLYFNYSPENLAISKTQHHNPHMTKIADLRKNYTQAGLIESDLVANPYQQFQLWFEQAVAADILEPNAMTLATVTVEGKPSARIVLLKAVDDRGFVFYTNYNSQKGIELQHCPYAALVFLWGDLERQVRIEGRIEFVSESEATSYFHSRPVSSQLGAWASDQSTVITDRSVLEQQLEQLALAYRNQEIPKPPHWGGVRVIPEEIEFWQGRPSRLHDRLRYQLIDGSWQIERLAP